MEKSRPENLFPHIFPQDLFINSPFWSAKLESLSHPVAIRMAQDLDSSGALGIGEAIKPFWKGFKHNFGKTDSNIDFLLGIKKKHPQKIALIQIGEFYETWGIDSVFLVEHCGINRMGKKGPRAGLPLANIQAALDDLTYAGFSVVVCEQADDIHKKGRKIRFISEIITPSSPTYTYGLAMSHKTISFPEAPPEFGIAVNSKGIKVVEINPDLRTCLILEGLTEEAAIIRLNKYSGRMNRIFLCDKLPKSLMDAANLKFQNLIKISGYSSRAFATRMEELIKIDLGLDANISFLKTKPTWMKDCPYPLYQQTAEQIGILPKRGIPDLIQLMLPKGSPATCKYMIRNMLLNPPAKNYADSLRQAIIELRSSDKQLPILIVSNPVRYIKTLNKKEAHPEILKDLFCLAEIFLNCQKNLSQNFIKNILEIISYISGVKAEMAVLQSASAKIIEILSPILPLAEDAAHIPKSELISLSLFERIEDEFRGRVAKTSNAEISQLYDQVKIAAQNYEEILETQLISIIENHQKEKLKTSTKSAKKPALAYDIHNHAIWISGNLQHPKLIRPIDRYGKEVKDRWTTKDAEEALRQYKEIAKSTYEAIKQILKKAAKELSVYCLPIIHLATFSNLVKTLYLHIKECQPRGWTTNFISLETGEIATGIKNGIANEVSNEIALEDFFPYWMKREGVTNSLNFNGTCMLTGHNMSGKSTLIRSLAAATLLGSCGFMFPAKKLSASPIDGWFVRTGAGDDPEAGLSAFAVEMTDIKVALRDATNKSFLLIDELGKGTESKAGHAIAASVLEHLARRNIRSIFATHWHEIFVNPTVCLENVKLIKMHCDGDIPTFKVMDGIDLNSSAFHTALKIGVDCEIVARAEEIAQGYDQFALANSRNSFAGNSNSENLSFENSSKNSSSENSNSDNFSFENSSNRAELFLENRESLLNTNSTDITLNNQNSVNLIKEILAAIIPEISPIKTLSENEIPPLGDIGHSIIYILKTANNFFYVGETDNFLHRVMAHRNNAVNGKCEFFYTIINAGKSQARQIEQQLITQLKDRGFPMLSISDATNSNFGALQGVA